MKIILKQKKNIYKYILHLYITSNFEKGKKKRKEEEGGKSNSHVPKPYH